MSKKATGKKKAADRSVAKKQGRGDASTNKPKDAVKSKAGKASAAARKAKREKGDPVARPCRARRTNGEPCKNSAIRGGTVCARHGGSAPQVRAKANQRLIEMVLPAMKELNRILNREDVADADKLRAIQMVLNRTGYSERQQIDIGLREETPFDRLSKGGAFTIGRGDGLREELEGMAGHPELPTHHGQADDPLVGGGYEDDLEAFLEYRARARQREASTRLNNDGHEVVTGEVHQRGSLDPFFTEEREREAYARSRSEFGPPAPKDDPARAYEDRLRERVEESERR